MARKSLLLAGKWPDCDQTCKVAHDDLQGRMHNTVVTATSKLKSIYDGVVFNASRRFTSKLSLVGLSACRKSVVAVLVNVNIAHDDVRTQRDEIPFFDDE